MHPSSRPGAQREQSLYRGPMKVPEEKINIDAKLFDLKHHFVYKALV